MFNEQLQDIVVQWKILPSQDQIRDQYQIVSFHQMAYKDRDEASNLTKQFLLESEKFSLLVSSFAKNLQKFVYLFAYAFRFVDISSPDSCTKAILCIISSCYHLIFCAEFCDGGYWTEYFFLK